MLFNLKNRHKFNVEMKDKNNIIRKRKIKVKKSGDVLTKTVLERAARKVFRKPLQILLK
jgi:hypothetical protein